MQISTCLLVLFNQSGAESCQLGSSLSAYEHLYFDLELHIWVRFAITVFILLEKNTWLKISGAGFESFMLFYLLRNRYVLLKKPAPNIFILNLIFCEKNIHFVFYIYWLANIRHLPVWPQYEANKYDKILAPWSNCSLTCSNKTLKTLHWKP